MARLAEDRVARLPVGANLVECDGKACTHEVAWPLGEEGHMGPPAKRDGPTAREYPFKIDPFQQTAINCLEAGEREVPAPIALPRAWRLAAPLPSPPPPPPPPCDASPVRNHGLKLQAGRHGEKQCRRRCLGVSVG